MTETSITIDAFHLQAQNKHTNHQIEWRVSGMRAMKQKCSRGGDILHVLKRGKEFSKLAKKNDKKDLVIIYRRRAISSGFPCCLIGDECLIVRYIAAVNKERKESDSPRISGPLENLVVFHLFLRGGGRTVKNPELKKAVGELSVYAYKGETVKHALRRDGRLHDIVFKNRSELLQKDTGETVPFSALVDDLDDKLFEISVSSQPNGRPGSFDADALVMDSQEDQSSDSDSEKDLDCSVPPTAECRE